MKTPGDYGLPHGDFRLYQDQAISWLLDEHIHRPTIMATPPDGREIVHTANGEDLKIMQAPTGSGKTGIATALGISGKVLALCETKALQETNYGQMYKYTVLEGRGNYPCIHPENKGMMCDDCLFGEAMSECEYSSECLYMNAKHEAQRADRASLNYPYFLTSRWPRKHSWDWVVMDEAHQLSDVVLGWAGCTVKEKERRNWNLPMFPNVRGSKGSLVKAFDPIPPVLHWLGQAMYVLRPQLKRLKKQAKAWTKARKMAKACENLIRKLEQTYSAIQACKDGWYIRSGPRGRKVNGRWVPALVCKPLSARDHFDRYFLRDHYKVVAMSATIGNTPKAFNSELGIGDHDWIDIPNQYPPALRPIYDLGAPPLGRNAKAPDYLRQASLIAGAILSLPADWAGIIHTMSRVQAYHLEARLAIKGLSDRVWTTPEAKPGERSLGTGKMMNMWEERKAAHPGSIWITWMGWMGIDLVEERICGIAKVPYPYLGDEYEFERMKANGSFYRLRTAWKFMQGSGRTRRTELDYDLDGQMNNFVFIADGNWTRIRSHLSTSFAEAIVPWEGN